MMLAAKAWSETEFEDGALKLVQVLHQIQDELPFDPPWSFRNGCLEATVTTTVSRESDSAETLPTETGTEDLEFVVDDETCPIWQDSDVAVLLLPAVGPLETSSGGQRQPLQHQRRLRYSWKLSAMYSHVWHVPVLYFTVQRDNGNHITRQELLTELQYYQSSHRFSSEAAAVDSTPLFPWSDSSWEFCSYEPHPVTGMPSFMVHPCQTKECLQVLQATRRRGNPCGVALDLWSWLSWILPSIGVSAIAPHTFQRVCRTLESAGNNAKS
jgi:Autophagocytosis associated protein, active-site domain